MPGPNRHLICPLVLLLVFLALWLPRLTGPINFRWDASSYYVLGTALAEGKGYRLLNEPGEIQAVQYPPLLPMFVAAHQANHGHTGLFQSGMRSAADLSRVLCAVPADDATGLRADLFAWPYALFVTFQPLSLAASWDLQTCFMLICHLRWSRWRFCCANKRAIVQLFAVASGVLAVAAYLLANCGNRTPSGMDSGESSFVGGSAKLLCVRRFGAFPCSFGRDMSGR